MTTTTERTTAREAAKTVRTRLGDYRLLPGAFDEMVETTGDIRDHWAPLASALGALGPDEMLERHVELDRVLEGDGVTYNITADGNRSESRRWLLDPVPVILSSREWAAVEGGVIQRAELLDAVLADLYGPRDLLRRGLLPPELVYEHPGFLRPCHGAPARNGPHLFTYAVDLSRDRSGNFVVLADRTQAPSGAGYALENRMAVSRVFPSMYREAQVHRLAPFFRSLRASLREAAPPGVDDPRVVVMTPGPHAETAFEHAYLASYLGYSLVEGSDLVVRDGRVWMRSIGRLEPVDVILRRVDDDYCDPLELRPDSRLGVPGLVDAARRGAVSVVNRLGSGVLENPALMAFLPRLCKDLLGQSLRLASAPTWWCGHASSRSHVLANLDRLVVKPIARGRGLSLELGSELSGAQRDELRRRIEARPHAWAAQEPVAAGAVPTLSPTGLEARRSVVRAYAVARGATFTVMPGALTRVGADDHTMLISNQSGGISKDTWVLASEPELLTGFWLRADGPPVEAVDPAGSMPSRAAENLFWLGRYAERAEGIARLLRVVYDRRNEFQGGSNPAGNECVELLVRAVHQTTGTFPGRLGVGGADELFSITADPDREGTLAYAVRRMLEAATAVRDQMSGDTWLVIGNLGREIAELYEHGVNRLDTVPLVLGRAMQGLLAFAGIAGESMVRDPGWQFMDAGRRLERALHLVSLLRAAVTVEHSTATDSLLLESVLTASESVITYRRRYRSQAQLVTVLDLLLHDPGNPRALVFQLDRLSEAVSALPRPLGARPGEEQRLVLRASTAARLADTVALAKTDENGGRTPLLAFCDELVGVLRRTGDAIDAVHFTRQLPQRSLASGGL